MLAHDASSSVFVELARALIEEGEHQRAADVCRDGVGHHPDSIIGRVLWGKALIHMGRPAEAMAQFELAISIDRENAYPYTLIAEVLLKRALYRSALPILRKAAILQPNDARIRRWLDQTQGALSGGPAPTLEGPDEGERTDQLTVPLDAVELRPLAAANDETPSVPDMASLAAPLLPSERPIIEPLTSSAPSGDRPDETRTALFEPLAQEGTSPPPTLEPTVIPSAELARDGEVERHEPARPSAAALQADGAGLPLVLPPLPSRAANGPARPLLEEVPEMIDPPSAVDVPKVELSTQVTKAIAEEYERELRQKLEAGPKRPRLTQRHAGKLALAAVLIVAGLAAGLYLWLLPQESQDLPGTLASARAHIVTDTPGDYDKALIASSNALKMAPGSTEAAALAAYAQAIVFAEHSRTDERRKNALGLLSRAGVREEHPALALASGYYLAQGEERAEAAQLLLGSALEAPEVHEAAGRELLAQGKTEQGVKRLSRAIEARPPSVRALALLGEYYRRFGDFRKADELYQTAVKLSPLHPASLVGAAEVRFALGEPVDDLVERLVSMLDVPLDLRLRWALVTGRALARSSRLAEGTAVLERAEREFPNSLPEVLLATADAYRAGGAMVPAQRALERLLKLNPRSEAAREALGRVLLARDQPEEVLARLTPQPDERKLWLVRGIALARLGDFRRARAELARTEVKGRYPPEAVIYLAQADAADDPARAEQALRKVVAESRSFKAEARVALGHHYWKRNQLDQAKALFEEAARDRDDYEGACALGRLLLSLGLPEVALESLQRSVARNGSHAESQLALADALLATGQNAEAAGALSAYVSENPKAFGALARLSTAYLRSSNLAEAEAAATRAVAAAPSSPMANRASAVVLFTKGASEAAFAALEKANALDPKDPLTFCEIGAAFVRNGSQAMALRAYQAAVREDPRVACGKIGLHYARLPGGGRVAARELVALREHVKVTWDRSFLESTLARVLLAMGDLSEARRAADEAVRLAPSAAFARLSSGLLAVREKREDHAVAELTRAVELDASFAPARLALADRLSRGPDEQVTRAAGLYEDYARLVTDPAERARARRLAMGLRKRLGKRQGG